jgi:hypothetical protein
VANLEAPSLPCRGCGAPLAVDPSSATAACPACRAVSPVPDDLRRRAIEYARTLATERGRIASARRPIEFEKVGLFFGPPAALLIGGHIVAGEFLDAETMAYEPSIFAGGLAVLGVAFFGYIAFTVVRSVKKIDAPEPPVVVEAFVGSVGSPTRAAPSAAPPSTPRRPTRPRSSPSPRRRPTSRSPAARARTCEASRCRSTTGPSPPPRAGCAT